MPELIRIGDEIINLDNVLRVEHGKAQGQTTVHVYFVGGERSMSQYSDEQAEAIWQEFAAIAKSWAVPGPVHHAPGGPGRVAQRT